MSVFTFVCCVGLLLTTLYASQHILKEQDEHSSAFCFRLKCCSLFMELSRVQKWAEGLEAVARNQQQFRTVVAFTSLVSLFCKKNRNNGIVKNCGCLIP